MSLLQNIPILSLLLLCPLVAIMAVWLLPSGKNGWLLRIAIPASLLPLALSMWLYADFGRGHGAAAYEEWMKWISLPMNAASNGVSGLEGSLTYTFYYALGVDGLSLPLILLTALLGSMAMMAAVYVKKRQKAFVSWLFLLQFGLLGVFLARDLILMFLFLELSALAVYFLVGIWGGGRRERVAKVYLALNGMASVFLLLAFAALIIGAGFRMEEAEGLLAGQYSGSYADIAANLSDPAMWSRGWPLEAGGWKPAPMGERTQWGVLLLMLAGFGIKAALLPMHTWSVKLYREAPSAVAMLHSGLMLKVGLYGFLRFGLLLFPSKSAELAFPLALLGLCQLLYGAVLAWKQTELKSMLAYASFSQLGLVWLGMASFNELGIQGAIFQMISHGLVFGLLFHVAGSLQERGGSTELASLGGLMRPMPFVGGLLLTGSLALIGLPGLSGFPGTFLTLSGAFQDHRPLALLAVVGVALTAGYALRPVLSAFFGEVKEDLAVKRDARFAEALPMIVLLAFIALLGFFPSVLTVTAESSVEGFIHHFMSNGAGG